MTENEQSLKAQEPVNQEEVIENAVELSSDQEVTDENSEELIADVFSEQVVAEPVEPDTLIQEEPLALEPEVLDEEMVETEVFSEPGPEPEPIAEEVPEVEITVEPLAEEFLEPEMAEDSAAQDVTKEEATPEPGTENVPEVEITEEPLAVDVPEAGITEEPVEEMVAETVVQAMVVNTDLPPINVNYTDYGRQNLVEALKLLLQHRTIHEITRDVENIRSTFYRKHNQETLSKKEKFLEEGGSEEEFKPAPDPLEEEFRELYDQYRARRSEYSKVLEEEKDSNLKRKLEIIEKIKGLLHTQESLNRTFNEFRDLQREWREIGPVPQSDLQSLWENYHHNVELFYDFIKINKELRDLDLKKNLEVKIHICEMAEELLIEPSVIKAFGELQKLHAEWREAGPVPREKKDELWDRFREATNQINKKHQDYYLGLKDEQKNNLDAKVHLCEKIEELLQKDIQNPKDWNEYSQEVVNLQRMWRSIGFAPRKENNKVYDRFRAGCDEFFNRKREYFSRHRDDQHENLQLKTDLCMQAEALMSSTEWRKTTEELVNIQRRWKEIGPVPRKYSDALWNRFRTACDNFFKSKSEHFSSQDGEQVENLKKKLELIDKVKNFNLTDNQSEDLMVLKTIQKDFTNIGHVPIEKKDQVQREFREAIHNLFDQLEIDDSKKEVLRYKQKVDNLVQSPKGKNRLSSEREKLVNKLKQMESDIVLWENNIGFFAKSQKSESLIREIENKIQQARERIQVLRDKVDMLDRFES